MRGPGHLTSALRFFVLLPAADPSLTARAPAFPFFFHLQVGDLIRVHFFNRAQIAHSLHAHGLRYDDENSGTFITAGSTTLTNGVAAGAFLRCFVAWFVPWAPVRRRYLGVQKAALTPAHGCHSSGLSLVVNGRPAPFSSSDGGALPPGSAYTYSWYAGYDSGPLLPPTDPHYVSSVAWPYHGHVDEPAETLRGMFGTIIVAGRLTANSTTGAPWDVDSSQGGDPYVPTW